jgi:hypothetical protein
VELSTFLADRRAAPSPIFFIIPNDLPLILFLHLPPPIVSAAWRCPFEMSSLQKWKVPARSSAFWTVEHRPLSRLEQKQQQQGKKNAVAASVNNNNNFNNKRSIKKQQ